MREDVREDYKLLRVMHKARNALCSTQFFYAGCAAQLYKENRARKRLEFFASFCHALDRARTATKIFVKYIKNI